MSPDLARSLAHRIRNLAAERRVEPARLRRHLAFQRLLARLANSQKWVLKGGYCLEVRLGAASRATKDLDVALLSDGPRLSALDLQDLLFTEVSTDPPPDGFRFEIAYPTAISSNELGNPGWRVTVAAIVDGTHFESIKLDVVARPDEIAGGVETLVVPPLLVGVRGHEPVAMQAVDVHQHAAEKLHAYTRIYARDRPSSRVKDLVDLVLLIEAGVLSPERLRTRLQQVYAIRDAAPPPAALPPPPSSWAISYADMAATLGLAASSVDEGWSAVAAEYHLALPSTDGKSDV